jgi:hypothetical protein
MSNAASEGGPEAPTLKHQASNKFKAPKVEAGQHPEYLSACVALLILTFALEPLFVIWCLML